MKTGYAIFIVFFSFCSFFMGCQQKITPQEVKKYPVDSLEGIITRANAVYDPAVSSDGKGSVRIDVNAPTTVRLYEVKGLDVEDARLTYRAKLRTNGAEGRVFLEMWCVFKDKGEYFSRALESPVTGNTDWVTQETPFFLKKGQIPETVKLNVVIEGKGTVWVDDVRLIKGPLQ